MDALLGHTNVRKTPIEQLHRRVGDFLRTELDRSRWDDITRQDQVWFPLLTDDVV